MLAGMLMRTDTREVLRAHPLFAAFDEPQFNRIADATQLVHVPAGRLLFQRGDAARAFFVVLEGQVKLFVQSRAGEEKILELMGSGQSFAEAVMFMEGHAYPVSAVATEPATLLAVPSRDYVAALKQSPQTCLRLLARLSQRVHAQVREIEELTLETAGNRLIRHLLRRAAPSPEGGCHVQLEESRQMLASRLAIKPETLSRLLRALSDAGLLDAIGRDIRIRDAERLRAHEM